MFLVSVCSVRVCRASRRSQAGGGTGPGCVPGVGGPPSPSTPGQVTIQVRTLRVLGACLRTERCVYVEGGNRKRESSKIESSYVYCHKTKHSPQ